MVNKDIRCTSDNVREVVAIAKKADRTAYDIAAEPTADL